MSKLQEAQSILTSTDEKLQPKKPVVDWLPQELKKIYYEKDLTYSFCLSQFGRIEATKREKLPETTMRSWFIEFIRLGWTQELVKEKTDILMGVKIYGLDKLEIADWINAEKELQINQQAYETYKPLPEQRQKSKGGLLGLREYIDSLDTKAKKEKPYYIDKKTNKKVYYPELPNNWKANLMNDWRRGDRIKKELRNNK